MSCRQLSPRTPWLVQLRNFEQHRRFIFFAISTPWLVLSVSYTCFRIAASIRLRSIIGIGLVGSVTVDLHLIATRVSECGVLSSPAEAVFHLDLSFWQSRLSQAIAKVIAVFRSFQNRYLLLRPKRVLRVDPQYLGGFRARIFYSSELSIGGGQKGVPVLVVGSTARCFS